LEVQLQDERQRQEVITKLEGLQHQIHKWAQIPLIW
jgi:hypothetical protein